MSYSISTLLTSNLSDVFGENDPTRRRAAIDEIFTEDSVFYDLKGGVYRGRDEIDRRFARPFPIASFSELAPTSEQLRDGGSMRDACEVNEAPLCCESVPRLYQSTPETRGGQQTGSLLSMRRLARPGHHLAGDGRT